jgi:hypothetical protein
MLEITLGCNGIAGKMGIAGELRVFFGNVLGGAAYLDVWPVRFE